MFLFAILNHQIEDFSSMKEGKFRFTLNFGTFKNNTSQPRQFQLRNVLPLIFSYFHNHDILDDILIGH